MLYDAWYIIHDTLFIKYYFYYIYLELQTTIVKWMKIEAKDYKNTETNSLQFWMIKIPYFKSSCWCVFGKTPR